MGIYIKSTGTISPQDTFSGKGIPENIIEYKSVRLLKCIEPAYRDLIDPMAARRMSRIVKMGVCAAKKCLEDSGIDMPDAIITGTGLGCIEDTEKFLGSMIQSEERLLNPTPFIQSTHNTVAAAIALGIKCHNYNSTYVHRGFSFEHALLDSMLLLQEHKGWNVLVGGLDEITENSWRITKRLRLWKDYPIDNTTLLDHNDRGSLPGEGVCFFLLGDQPGYGGGTCIHSVRTLYKPKSLTDVEKVLSAFLADAEVDVKDLDLVIYGFSGDREGDKVYHHLLNGLFRNRNGAYYKHLCGEYDTSVSFALWLADLIINRQEVPAAIGLHGKQQQMINHVLIYNHVRNINHSMLLVSKC